MLCMLTLSVSVVACSHLQHDPMESAQTEVDIEYAQQDKPEDLQLDGIWQRVRDGFALEEIELNPAVEKQVRWHQCNPDYLLRVSARSEPFLYLILEQIEERGLPTELVLLPVIESAYVPYAYSPGRAAGIWQFIPSTGRVFKLRQNWWYDGRRDVYASTRAALDYLQQLYERFDNDWLLALAAYNAGPLRIERAIRKNLRKGKPVDYWHLELPRETRRYVPKFLALKHIVADPAKFWLELWPVSDEPYLEPVELDTQIDLALAAELADMSIDEIYMLNPGFNRWATDPNGGHHLLLPVDRIPLFLTRLQKVPASERVTWTRHKIRQGETLSHIAMRYNTTVGSIKSINQLRSNRIRAGHYLVVPKARQDMLRYTKSADQRRKHIQATSGSGHRQLHTVSAGDSFWSIARTYKVGVKQLAKWNGMAPRDLLRPGDELVVWLPEEFQPQQSPTSKFWRPPSDGVVQKIRYSVRRGDSLYTIAQRFKVSIDDIVRWNKLPDIDFLRPGQVLKVYIDITRQY